MENSLPLLSLQATVQDLFSNAIFSIISFVGKKTYEAINEQIKEDNVFNSLKDEIVHYVLQETNIEEEVAYKNIQTFLNSQEVESIIRQIYAAQITQDLDGFKDSVKQEFCTLLAFMLNIPENKINLFSSFIFDKLLEACTRVINIVENANISIEQIKTEFRF